MSGWIKLHRKLLHSDMYKALNAVQRDVMLQLLLKANHDHRKWEWKGKVFQCQPGEFITSIDSIKNACSPGTSAKNVRTALAKLEMWEFLANESASTGRKITIVNWGRYQGDDEGTGKPNGRKTAGKRQTTGRQLATNKNNKELKEGIRGKKFTPPTYEDVNEYCLKRKNKIDHERFVDFYASKNWMVGKNKMKDWKAAVRTWEKNEPKKDDEWR